MTTITIPLGEQSYPIHIETNLLSHADRLSEKWPEFCPKSGQIFIISNEKIWSLYSAVFEASLKDRTWHKILVPDGEKAKDRQVYFSTIENLLQNQCGRDGVIIALGGGTVGDLAGFVAATYMRGIQIIQIPTTLLAQVDSAVGGKTAINHPLAKNCIGAIKQPCAVLIDPQCIKSLDQRQVQAGFAEVIKYGLIADESFFSWLEKNIVELRKLKPTELAHAIHHSCQAKAQIVSVDPLDQKGQRTLLNLGHTFGHGLEQTGKYSQWLHGEAVACGMVMAAHYSHQYENLDKKAVDRIEALIDSFGLPIRCPNAHAEDLLQAMLLDKKNVGGHIRLILLKAVGSAYLRTVGIEELQEFMVKFTKMG